MAAQSKARSRWSALFIGGLLFLLAVDVVAVEFTPLGHLPERLVQSDARGVSGDGRVVVGESGREAFRWTAEEGMVGLGSLLGGSSRSRANATSFDGSVIVGRSDADPGTEGFRWTQLDGMQGMGFAEANDVSADGTVIVGSNRRWTRDTGAVMLPFPIPGECCWDGWVATVVSADGAVIAGDTIVLPNGTPFRWTEGIGSEILFFPPPPIANVSVYDMSEDGSVIVGLIGYPYDSFRWTESQGLEILELPDGAEQSLAWAVSADGSVIAGFTSTFFDPSSSEYFDAAIWDEAHGWRDVQKLLINAGLDLSGWDLRMARDISADGRVVVGYGINPDGNREAWMAVIPEPGTLVMSVPLVAFAVCVLRHAGRARR